MMRQVKNLKVDNGFNGLDNLDEVSEMWLARRGAKSKKKKHKNRMVK